MKFFSIEVVPCGSFIHSFVTFKSHLTVYHLNECICIFFLILQADKFIDDEVQYLRVAMGHENESIDGYVEAHKTCLNDIMYFPTRRDGYGLASVANHAEKVASLQNEFENVKKKMDDETKKAQRHEQKIKVLTNGYQVYFSSGVTF